MTLLEPAYKLRPIIEEAVQSLDERTASMAVTMFPKLKANGKWVKAEKVINWNGTLKRAAADLLDTAENTPDAAPNLWEDIAYKEGYRVIPEIITAGTAFAFGEVGWWGEKLYKSRLEANVWTPDVNPDGWEEV